MRDFLPSASLEIIKLRASLLKRLRGFFDERDFVEVTTPVLSADTVIDEHLDPLSTTLFRDPRNISSGDVRYLQTSPEFHMKRLVAAGMERIYQVGPAFRGAESGDIHNTEFTMVEWYRVGDDMQAGMALLAELARTLLDVPKIDFVSYSDAFLGQLNIDPLHCSDEEMAQASEKLRPAAVKPNADSTDSRDDLLNLLWSHSVEPTLGKDRPVIIFDYPPSQAALARVRSQPAGPVAERFELYFRGVELANGYHELIDAAELEKRNAETNEKRAAAGKPRLPEDSRLLAAMQAGLPSCAGVALGFDRFVMVAMTKSRLDEVMPFPDQLA